MSARSNRIVLLESTVDRPDEVFALEAGKARQLTHHNDAWLSGVRLAPVDEISFASKDGTQISGFLVTPPDYAPGRKYPTLLQIHGGPVSQFANAFMPMWQILASQGYVVVAANPRGSSGRGEAFATAIWAEWGGKDTDDVLGAVDYAVSKGIADPERLGVGGWSYGGILTDIVITKDSRFKAATSGASIGNALAGYGTDMYVREYELELGTPWKNLDAYLRNAYPLLHADRIKTPTLFLCGSSDFNVPLLNSEQMYQALRSTGVDTQLIIYPDQFHGLSKPSYLRDRMQRYRGMVWEVPEIGLLADWPLASWPARNQKGDARQTDLYLFSGQQPVGQWPVGLLLVHLSRLHDERHRFERPHVGERIVLHGNDVRGVAGGNVADLAFESQCVGTVEGCGLQRLQRRHAIANHHGKLLRVIAVAVHAGVGAEREFDTGLDRFLEIVALCLRDFAILAQEFFELASLRAFALGVVGVVDVHGQPGAGLLRQLQAFIVNETGVLDGIDAGANRNLDAIGAVRVNRHAAAKHVRFVNQCGDFLGRVLLGAGCIAFGENTAGAAILDDVGPVLDVTPHYPAHFDRAVRHAFGFVLKFRGEHVVVAVPAGDSQCRTRRQNPRAGHIAVIDGISQRDVAVTLSAHVTDCRDSRQQCHSRVGGTFQREAGNRHTVAEVRRQGRIRSQMGVSVDQSGQHGGCR